MSIVMGVDGGGSKTYTVITDEYGNHLRKRNIRRRKLSNYWNRKSNKNITESIETALKAAALNYSDIDYVQYGLAGADREKDINIINEGLKNIPI